MALVSGLVNKNLLVRKSEGSNPSVVICFGFAGWNSIISLVSASVDEIQFHVRGRKAIPFGGKLELVMRLTPRRSIESYNPFNI